MTLAGMKYRAESPARFDSRQKDKKTLNQFKNFLKFSQIPPPKIEKFNPKAKKRQKSSKTFFKFQRKLI